MKTTPLAHPAPIECAYLAGIMDGEGSIMAYVSTWTRQTVNGGRREDWIQLKLCIANTDYRLIEWIADFWPGHISTSPKPDGQKPVHYFYAQNNDMPVMLFDVLPYLVIKREQAELAAELVRSKRNPGRAGYPPEEKARRVAIARQIQQLNLKGSRPRAERHYDQHDGSPRPRGGPAAL